MQRASVGTPFIDVIADGCAVTSAKSQTRQLRFQRGDLRALIAAVESVAVRFGGRVFGSPVAALPKHGIATAAWLQCARVNRAPMDE